GHPEPEFEESAGSVTVRFLVAGYTPPHRIEHDLTDRQRRILHGLRDGERKRFKEIAEHFEPPLAERTLRFDLTVLRTLGLIGSAGRGQGARWWLRQNRTT